MKHALGRFLILTPILFVMWTMIYTMGWPFTLVLLFAGAVLGALVTAGVYLITD